MEYTWEIKFTRLTHLNHTPTNGGNIQTDIQTPWQTDMTTLWLNWPSGAHSVKKGYFPLGIIQPNKLQKLQGVGPVDNRISTD